MFIVKAAFSEQLEMKTNCERVREFFADTRNFVELMPSIEGIKADAAGVTHWTIRAEIPFLGSMTQIFKVELTENSSSLIEWTPARGETKNFLRYSADITELGENNTAVRIAQSVELRRDKASQLHMLAGLAGATVISQQMQKRVEAMIKTFLEKARTRLES